MNHRVTFLILLISFAACIAHENTSNHIVGGQRAREGQFPYAVILRGTLFDLTCGGSILNTRWVLTAAHCLGFFNPQTEIEIVAGSINRSSTDQVYSIESFVIHPLWIIPPINANDIGLVRVDRPIQFSQQVQPIRLRRQSVLPGDLITIAGWGQEGQGLFPVGPPAPYLNFLNSRAISNRECRLRLSPAFGIGATIRDNVFCAVGGFGQGVCFGDSGSGVILNGEIVGITSQTIPCGLGFPDWFPRIADYADWIENVILN